MNYRDKVFIKVAENLSFSKASKELFISQPAVSKHIKELERELKTTLFLREGSQISLTKSGKLAYNFLKKIEKDYRELNFQIGLLNQHFKGHLRLGASSTISQYLIPKLMAAFHKRYPEIELFLFNGNSFQVEHKLLNNDIDLALVENNTSHPLLNYNNFLEDEIIAVTGINSVYAKRQSMSINDLYHTPLVLREKGSGTLEVIQTSLKKNKIDLNRLNILIHLGSTEAIKNFLYNFDGLAFISEKALEKEFKLKEIMKINFKKLRIQRQFRLAQRQGQQLSTVNIFIDFLNHYNF